MWAHQCLHHVVGPSLSRTIGPKLWVKNGVQLDEAETGNQPIRSIQHFKAPLKQRNCRKGLPSKQALCYHVSLLKLETSLRVLKMFYFHPKSAGS